MSSYPERLIELAEELIRCDPRSGAAKRRAVSNAYYAAFHKLMGRCASALLPYDDTTTPLFERVYRALDHNALKLAFQGKDNELNKIGSLRKVGALIVPLQSARMTADYAVPRPNVFTLEAVRNNIAKSREIIDELEALSEADSRVLAIHLLFKTRVR